MNEFFLTLLTLLTIFFINRFRATIAQKTNLIDKPNKVRKFHLTQTPLLGGLMIYSTFVYINLYSYFFSDYNNMEIVIFAVTTCFFFIGLLDDNKGIPYSYKLAISFILLYFALTLEPNLQINKIYFISLNKYFNLGDYSIFFTLFCLMLLINSINLIDGIDGLCILIIIIFFISIILFFENIILHHVMMVIALFYILLLNLKKNIFIGDSGSLFLGSLTGLLIINNYNNQLLTNNYPVENVFIILMLPGIDMFRVFMQRALKNKNPFTSDRIHLHYLLLDKPLTLNKTLTVLLSLILIPISVNLFTKIASYQIILSYILVYILLILYLYRVKIK